MSLIPEVKIDFTPLIQSIPNSVGIIFNWAFGKSVSRRKAAQLLIEARTEREARLVKEGKLDVDEDGKIVNFEQMQSDNIQESIEFAVQEALSKEQSQSSQSSSTHSSQTFFNHWRGYVKNIDEAELKKLWGKLLATEAYEPNTVSLRLLNALSMMSKYEIDTFVSSLPYIIDGGFIVVDFIPENTRREIFHTLYSMGLVTKIPSNIKAVTSLTRHKDNNLNFLYIIQRDKLVAFHDTNHDSPEKQTFCLELIELTKLGKELYAITDEGENECSILFNSIKFELLASNTINKVSIYKLENNTIKETLMEKSKP